MSPHAALLVAKREPLQLGRGTWGHYRFRPSRGPYLQALRPAWVGRVTSTSCAKMKLPNLRRLDVRRNEVDEKPAATDPRICV